MLPEGALPCPDVNATDPYRPTECDHSSPHLPHYFFFIVLNIILPYTRRSSK
jgi:hypothetical protein